MNVLSEFTVPADEFVLADTLTAAPKMRIEIKRVVGGETFVTPYFWASGGDFGAFERALADDEMVKEVLTLQENEEPIDEVDDADEERFYRVRWEADVTNMVSAVADATATILEAVSVDGDRWEIKVLFPSEGDLTEFHEYCLEHEFDVTPQRIYHPENQQEEAEYGVTEEQQEALEAAYHAGYFHVPRAVTQEALAGELDISSNALSARLRRGYQSLVGNTLVHSE